MGIRWLQVVTANCGKLLERPLTLQIKMTKWRWISHTLMNGDESVKSKKWIGICREPKGEEDRSKSGKGPFWKKQENSAKLGARESGWRAAVRCSMGYCGIDGNRDSVVRD